MTPRRLAVIAASVVVVGCEGSPPRMQVLGARGPLALHVVHPGEGDPVQAPGATYLIGSVGNGAATLSVNGHPVAVNRNGSFLAFLPLPDTGAPAYRLVAALGGDTVRRWLPVTVAAASATFPLTGPLAVDTASLAPRERLRLRAGEAVRVSVRAPADARVWVAVAGGRHPLRANAPVPAAGQETPWGAPRRRDPERWAAELPAARLAGGAVLVVARRGDTLRLPLAPVEIVDPARPTWVVLGASGGDREIVGRPSPEGEYRWFFLPGTAVVATGARGDMLRVRLDSGQEVWVASNVAAPLATRPVVGAHGGAARLRPAPDWVDVVVPLPTPPAYRVEQGERELSLTLYGVAPGPGAAATRAADSYVLDLAPAPELRDRTRYTLRLASAPYGYEAFWRDGAFVLRVRRPPAIHARAPLRGLTIAVDAGHPPHGAVGPTGLREADVTLRVAHRLERLLRARGARVVLTRAGEGPVSLEERTARARRASAHALVSIHADALGSGQDPSVVNGTATFFFHPQSAPLAGAVQRRMVARIRRADRGFRPKNLAVARATWMPAVLCEGAMIVHPDEEAALRSPAFQEAYARGIAEGLEAYFRGLKGET